MKIAYLGFVFAGLQMLSQWAFGFGSKNTMSLCSPFISYSYEVEAKAPTAVDDNFILAVGCENYVLKGNLLANDNYNIDHDYLSQIETTSQGELIFYKNGDFTFTCEKGFRGEINLRYRVESNKDNTLFAEAQVFILVDDDYDCDKVINRFDIDCDNDGILDIHEGKTTDTDGDGIPNCLDIDSDNDGITDYMEWQVESSQCTLALCDANGDGWDAGFDPEEGGNYYEQVDTDLDGVPDYLDNDSDNDGISDYIEAFDVSNRKEAVLKFSGLDTDNDGLDDSFDNINGSLARLNATGSISPLPDNNKNGIRDWRDMDNYIVEGEEQNLEETIGELRVFPNPASQFCSIHLPSEESLENGPFSIKVFNSNGEMVHIDLFNNSKIDLHLDGFSKGMYFIRIKTNRASYTHKLIKSE